ncbi:MAG: hypothetical protein KBT02_02590 [Treponema sp.]|nr:hypothetical protein [Candidatus Treponema caballi]
MKKKVALLYISAFLSVVIPVPARVAYGIIMLLIMNIVMFLGTTAKFLIRKLDIEELEPVCLLVFLYSITILCKQLLIMYSPLTALTLSFDLYLIPISSFILGYILTDKEMNPKMLYKKNMSASGIFTGFALIFYIIREMLAFGSISLPVKKGIHVIKILSSQISDYTFFFATIPGAFVILSVLVAIFAFIERHVEINRRKN